MRTVTILSYNRPEYLEQCIHALIDCRGVDNYAVLVSVDGGSPLKIKVPPSWEIVYLQNHYGIDHHNAKCYNAVFDRSNDVDFNVALEDDVILSPDALELADWFYGMWDAEDYAFCSLGDPHYRKVVPRDENYREIHECRSIYTSAWCFSRAQWERMRPEWNRQLKTQLGWDWSLAMAMHEYGWKSLYPLVSRARNIGRVGVHSHEEFFDREIAGAVYSDGRHTEEFAITYRMGSESTPDWIQRELKETYGD